MKNIYKNDFKKLAVIILNFDLEIKRLSLENKRLENEISRLYRRQNYGVEYTKKKIERVKKGIC